MKNKKSFLIYLIVYLAYTSIYVARVNLSVASPALQELGVFDAAGYGVIGGLFSAVYAVGRLVMGGVGDKTPPWIMLSVGLGFAGVANLLLGFLPPYVAVLILWLINAWAQSMLWSSVLCVVSSLYSGDKLKRMTSLMVTAVATGNVVSIILSTWVIYSFGVAFAFIVPGGFTLIMGIVIVFVTRGIKSADVSSGEEKKKHISVFGLLGKRDILLMCIPSVFHGVMKENVSVWMFTYAKDAFSVDLSTSSYFLLVIPLIGLVGRLLYPLALRALGGRENRVSIIGFGVCILASVLLLFKSFGFVTALISLALIYAASSMVNTSITSIYPMSYRASGNVASVSGLLDFASYLGAGVSGIIYGFVIEKSEVGYPSMFISWIVLSFLSAAMLVIINALRRKENEKCALQ